MSLSQVEFQRQVAQSLWELPKPHLKQTVSCQQLPSKKQLVSLLTQLSVVRKTISLDLKKMLSSVRSSQLVLVWPVTVTLNHMLSTKKNTLILQ
ncbi:Uncharacterised protein [Mycobacterium tuberculosis]|nr:Uncharacterised protein [Mycobacterium tuberculosis]